MNERVPVHGREDCYLMYIRSRPAESLEQTRMGVRVETQQHEGSNEAQG